MLAKMISGLVEAMSCESKALTVAKVPTGIKIGVCTTPCSVVSSPALALPFWEFNLKVSPFIACILPSIVLKLTDFDYHLPEENIAQMPAVPRDSSKLLVLNRMSGEISHRHFFDLPDLLDESYVIVRNNTKVMPARIFGEKSTGGKVELLLLKRVGIGESGELWEVLSKRI